MQLTPTKANVLVQLKDIVRDSKIVLPDEAKMNPYGLVLAVGPDCENTAINDMVLFLPSNMIGMEDDRGNVYIVPEQAIFAKYTASTDAPLLHAV